jgi:hypothetical protein
MERELDKIGSVLSYSPSLLAATKFIFDYPPFVDVEGTFSFKFIRVARFLKDNAPHVFQITRIQRLRTAWIYGCGTF